MSENTKQKDFASPSSLEVTRASRSSELESAKILFQEGLLEESRKKLYQILINFPEYPPAVKLLQQIQDNELKGLLSQSLSGQRPKKQKTEDVDAVIQKLNYDLGLELNVKEFDPERENWIIKADLNPRERFDLGVAFYEMGCYQDAVRELKISERQIRMGQTFLGDLGVAVVGLYSESLVHLGKAFDAKTYLEPILSEPDLNHEGKNVLFYVMGLAEESLGHVPEAKGWFQRVHAFNPDFRDVSFRLARFS